MKFSIITPSYNQGRFLTDCIESVLSQQGVDIEHIVTDAGSTDETLDVLRRYPHVKWASEPDKGMSDGINKGFLQATGDWMMWLNCDDYLLPGVLAKVAAFIEQHPQAEVVHGDCVFVNEDKTVIRRKYDHEADTIMLLFVGCFIPSTSCFFKRSVIAEGHILDIDYKNNMDWEYFQRLLRIGKRFAYIPEAIAGFRWHGNNTSLVHQERGWREARRLQRQHMELTGMPSWLGQEWVLRVLRRVFQVIRVTRRLRIHGKLH